MFFYKRRLKKFEKIKQELEADIKRLEEETCHESYNIKKEMSQKWCPFNKTNCITSECIFFNEGYFKINVSNGKAFRYDIYPSCKMRSDYV